MGTKTASLESRNEFAQLARVANEHSLKTLRKLTSVLKQWHRNYTTRRQLSRLNDHELRDIGLERDMVRQECRKAFWQY